MTSDKAQSIIASIILQHGGPDPTAWMKEHNVGVPTDGDTQKIAYSKDGRDVRLKQRTGRFIKAYLWPDITDVVLQEVSAKINAVLWVSGDAESEFGVKELRGEKLRECYRNSGIRSCMSGDASDYLDIYVDNPDKVCLLYVELPDGKARALCWSLSWGSRYQDRVYFTSASAKEAIFSYANKHDMLKYNDGNQLPSMPMKIRNGEKSYWPYADTFIGCEIVSTKECILYYRNKEYTLTNTDGTLGGATTACCCCNESLQEGEEFSYGDEIYCENCYGDHFTCCDVCEEDKPNADVHYVDNLSISVCDDCMSDYAECEDCGKTYKKADMLDMDNGYYCEDCTTSCAQCEELTPTRDTQAVGLNTYCEDCFEELYDTCEKCRNVYDKGTHCPDCATDEMCHGKILQVQADNPEHVSSDNAQGGV